MLNIARFLSCFVYLITLMRLASSTGCRYQEFINTQAFGGTEWPNATSLQQCMDACEANALCSSIDWDPNNEWQIYCWLGSADLPSNFKNGLTRYIRVCTKNNTGSVYEGHETRFNCSTSFENSPRWQHHRIGNKRAFNVSLNNTILPKYSSDGRFTLLVDPSRGRYDLEIKGVKFGDAGIYTCVDSVVRGQFNLTVEKEVIQLVSGPVNTSVVVGRGARLKCSTSFPNPVYWYHRKVHAKDTAKAVFFGEHGVQEPYSNTGRFVVHPENGQYDLIIRNVERSDAGTYTCADNMGDGERASAELIVLVSTPSCMSTNFVDETAVISTDNSCGLEPDQISVLCQVNYSGNIWPTLEWGFGEPRFATDTDKSIYARRYNNGQKIHITTYDLFVNYDDPNTVTLEMYAVADTWINYVPLECRVKESYSNNQKCSIPTKLYEFPPATNISYTNVSRSEFEYSMCVSTEAEQHCILEWRNETGGVLVSAIGRLPSTKPYWQPGNYTCFIVCRIREKSCTRAKIVVSIFPETAAVGFQFEPALVLAFIVCVGVVVLILAFILISRICSSNPKSRQKENIPLLPSKDSKQIITNSTKTTPQEKIDTGANVRGIVVLDRIVYIARGGEKIDVYNYENGEYRTHRFISVVGLQKAKCMAAYSLIKFIFISEEENSNIHSIRVSASAKVTFGKFEVKHVPDGLSVTNSGRLVLTFPKLKKLGIYDWFGNNQGYIDLPEAVGYPFFAVEININEYLVSHGTDAKSADQISKVKTEYNTSEVNIGTSCNHAIWPGAPNFAVTPEGNVFVADPDKNIVTLLNSELASEQIFAVNLGRPTKLCYDDSNRRLYVLNQGSEDVYIYDDDFRS